MKWLSDIYFLNATALAKELRAGSFSEARAIKHLIVAFVLGGIGFDVPISIEKERDTAPFLFALGIAVFFITALIIYYGVWLAHQVNQKGDGKDFFLRFAALSLPVGVYLTLVFLIVGAVLVGILMFAAAEGGALGYYLGATLFMAATVAFVAMFFLRMRACIVIASGAE